MAHRCLSTLDQSSRDSQDYPNGHSGTPSTNATRDGEEKAGAVDQLGLLPRAPFRRDDGTGGGDRPLAGYSRFKTEQAALMRDALAEQQRRTSRTAPDTRE